MDKSNNKTRKVRFAPKLPSRNKLPKPKTEEVIKEDHKADDDDDAQAQLLLHRFNENFSQQGRKVERKAPVEVAFGQVGTPSSSLRTYSVPKDERNDQSSTSRLECSDSGKGQSDTLAIVPHKTKKEYKEPWDYHHTYYPTTLPLRRPYSGDPEILDEAEFGEAARNAEYDESNINSALELGLMEESEKEKMFMFQLPASLPLVKRSASAKGKEPAEGSKRERESQRGYELEELPGGQVGKLMVYKSGTVKLKLGETLYNVSPGSDCVFAQDVAAISTAKKQCCVIGNLGKRAVVTPDIDSILDAFVDLG